MTHMKLTINGQEIEVLKGTAILEAAKSAGIYIPTLCYQADLLPARGREASRVVYQGPRKIQNAMPEEMGKGCGLCSTGGM